MWEIESGADPFVLGVGHCVRSEPYGAARFHRTVAEETASQSRVIHLEHRFTLGSGRKLSSDETCRPEARARHISLGPTRPWLLSVSLALYGID